MFDFILSGTPNRVMCAPLVKPAYVNYGDCYDLDLVSQELMGNNTRYNTVTSWKSECPEVGNYGMVAFRTSADGSGALMMRCCQLLVENTL